MDIHIQVWKKGDDEYVANCPELEIFCYGKDELEARARIKKVIEFYAETASDLGYKIDTQKLLPELEEHPFGKKENNNLIH